MSNESYDDQPFLSYSTTQERAKLFDTEQFEDSDNSMSRKKRSGGNSKKRRATKKGKKPKGFKLNKGRLSLQVAGFSGKQNLTASEIVAFVPLSKIKAAAKRALLLKGVSKKKKKSKRKGKKKKSG